VIFSNDVCAYSGFDGVELATGGVSGGIWLFTTRRSFFTSVWLARGDDQLVCDYLGAQCDRNEWPGEQTWDQIKLELTEEIPIRKSSRVSHTVSTGASISIHVLASNTPEDSRDKLLSLSARVVLAKIALVYTTTQDNELLHITVKGWSEECHLYLYKLSYVRCRGPSES